MRTIHSIKIKIPIFTRLKNSRSIERGFVGERF